MSDSAVVKVSRFGFAETLQRLRDGILSGGSTLFATIDQAAAAQGAGTALRPTVLLLFGNPRGGTPLMQSWPLAALELPLKLLVWEDDAVRVAYLRTAAVLPALGVALPNDRVAAMDAMLEALASSATTG